MSLLSTSCHAFVASYFSARVATLTSSLNGLGMRAPYDPRSVTETLAMYTAAPPEGFTWGYDTRSTTETYEQYLEAKASEEAAPPSAAMEQVAVVPSMSDTVLKTAAPPAPAITTVLTVGQACTFMYANDDVTIEEKAAYLKGMGISDFVIAQATCCSMLDRFGPVLDCEPAAAAPAAIESALNVQQACTFLYANDDVTIEEKAAYLKGKGISDFVIAQATCCSMLDRFGPVLDCEPAAAAPTAIESALNLQVDEARRPSLAMPEVAGTWGCDEETWAAVKHKKSLIKICNAGDEDHFRKRLASIKELLANAPPATPRAAAKKAGPKPRKTSATKRKSSPLRTSGPYELFGLLPDALDAAAIQVEVDKRTEAKLIKDYTAADTIREVLAEQGIRIRDDLRSWSYKNPAKLPGTATQTSGSD